MTYLLTLYVTDMLVNIPVLLFMGLVTSSILFVVWKGISGLWNSLRSLVID